MAQGKTPAEIRAALVAFAQALAAALSQRTATTVDVDTLDVLSVPRQFESIVRGDHEIGY
jgi:hypothetical protein